MVAAGNLRHATGQPLRGRQVQEFVRAMCIRAGAEHAGDQELRLREPLAQHALERDRHAFAHVHGGRAEIIP
jgi:hypothetical protein